MGRVGIPRWLGIDSFDQVRRRPLDPFRANRGDGAGIQFGCLDHLGGHHPRRIALEQDRAGENIKLGPAGAVKFMPVTLMANIGKQPRQQRPVDGIGFRGRDFFGKARHRNFLNCSEFNL